MPAQRIRRRLALFAVAVIVGHHLGTLFGPLGGPGDTRWGDWADLVVPYGVVGSAAAVLASVQAGRLAWTLLVATGLVYTQGHGIHLAANSIANVEPSDAVHLWDETVGHWIWYGGLAGLVGTLAYALDEVAWRRDPWSVAGAIAFGVTVFTNSVEGGTAVLGLVSGVVFVAWGLRRRGRAPELLIPTYAVTIVCLLAWGVYWRGFPQFSELGWI